MDIDIINTIGDRIARYRAILGVTQQQLARAVKRSTSWVSAIERGLFEPSIDDLHRIADALGVDPKIFSEQPNKRRRLEHL